MRSVRGARLQMRRPESASARRRRALDEAHDHDATGLPHRTDSAPDPRGGARERNRRLGKPRERLQAEGGEPLRCCLRDANPGEALILFGYAPPIGNSPYREIGAVFAHAAACAGPAEHGAYPAGWRGRRQVLRAYDGRGWILDACVHDGAAPEAEIERLLADPRAAQLHSRNLAYGCFMFVVGRRGSTAEED
jgi:Protein of unknown function (DUF1203)